MKFKDMLKYLREHRELSQRELASLLNVSPGSISMYETGQREPSMEMEEKIAKFFGVSLNTLHGIDDEQKSLNLTEDEVTLLELYRTNREFHQLLSFTKFYKHFKYI